MQSNADESTLNINVGILGHVDSGKTTLAKALTTTTSTACFDKDPQSRQRGITLDLGFSCFDLERPGTASSAVNSSSINTTEAASKSSSMAVTHQAEFAYLFDHLIDSVQRLQFTLVDCPGHASLIKTILSGAHLIDVVVLVIDVTKGIQIQTAECILIAEILCGDTLVIALNKVDLIPANKRAAHLEKMKKKLNATFERTKFKHYPIVFICAAQSHPLSVIPSGDSGDATAQQKIKSSHEQEQHKEQDAAEDAEATQQCEQEFSVRALIHEIARCGLDRVLRNRCPDATLTEIEGRAEPPVEEGEAILAVDHCFTIRSKGTILTGTVLHGALQVSDSLYLPSLKTTHKIKGLQVFRRAVQRCVRGDRVGVCVTWFNNCQLERSLVCKAHTSSSSGMSTSVSSTSCATPPGMPSSGPPLLRLIHACIVRAIPIRYFRHAITTGMRLQITMAMSCVTAQIAMIFVAASPSSSLSLSSNQLLDWSAQFEFRRDWTPPPHNYQQTANDAASAASDDDDVIYVLLELEKPVICANRPDLFPPIIAFTLDQLSSAHTHAQHNAESNKQCRFVFHGRPVWISEQASQSERTAHLTQLRVLKRKRKIGQIDRIMLIGGGGATEGGGGGAGGEGGELIVRNMFKKDANIERFVNFRAQIEVCFAEAARSEAENTHDDDEASDCATHTNADLSSWRSYDAQIIGAFGKSGKIKLAIKENLPHEVIQQFCASKSGGSSASAIRTRVSLNFSQNAFDRDKRIFQC